MLKRSLVIFRSYLFELVELFALLLKRLAKLLNLLGFTFVNVLALVHPSSLPFVNLILMRLFTLGKRVTGVRDDSMIGSLPLCDTARTRRAN
jgi:hypothetical protein